MNLNNTVKYVIIHTHYLVPINNLKGGVILEREIYAYLIFIAGIILIKYLVGANDKKSYPKGKELLNQLQKIGIQGTNFYTFNIELIDPYIFRDYVYRYEMIGGYSREVALKMAFEEYKKTYIK